MIRLAYFVCWLMVLGGSFRVAAQVQVFVSPGGQDASPGNGSQGQPYRTIARGLSAINSLPAGGVPVLVVLAGLYPQSAPLDVGRPMTLRGQGGRVVVDGGNRLSATGQYLLGIRQVSGVTVEGITFRNCINNGAKGIWITDGATSVTVQRCTIENVGWLSNDLGTRPPATSPGISASAIKVEGNRGQALTTIRLLDDSVRNCAVGYGEGITITGNVDGFAVLRNVVHDIANVGIDAAGNYGAAPAAPLDHARNGLIAYNQVARCMSGRAMSAGIYLDGALDCTVVGNRCTENGVGLSVGSEQAVASRGRAGGRHRLWSNQVTGNVFGGLSLGTGAAGRPARRLEVLNNTVWGNQTGAVIHGLTSLVASNGQVTPLPQPTDTDGGEVFLQGLDSVQFENNILAPRNGKPALYGSGYEVAHFQSNYNCYYSAAGAYLFQISNRPFNGLSLPGNIPAATVQDFYDKTGLDAASIPLMTNPGLANPAAGDFTLAASSPLLNQGNPATRPATGDFALDCAGRPRLVGSRLDLGAYENQTALATAPAGAAPLVALYPNPTTGPCRLTNAPAVRQLVVRTPLGVVAGIWRHLAAQLDLSALPPGLYLVEISLLDGPPVTQRLVVQ